MHLPSHSAAFFILLLQCIIPWLNFASIITVENNGYKGIVVAIHNKVPEDLELLENIKTLFLKASKFLYTSTKQSVYFKEVKIVVPSTWSQQPEYEILPGNFFSSAHIRVDEPNPVYKDTPYTVQPGGCGEPGQYIHLTPWFLKELHGKTVEMFGAPERQLVHEWAHLRYGVFDEYGMPGDKRYPMFYQENGRVRPTSCVRDIKGWIESRDGGPCTMTADGQVDSDCIFIPNMHSNEAKASIMYMPFIPSMEGFCDDGSHRHNVLAPTKHNAMCNYRSTWDIISSHTDFKKRSKRDAQTDELTETLFRVIQSPKNPSSQYVLLLDVSGSMNGQPMKLLHAAATRLVEDRVQDGAFLGIVQFSTEASILRNLTKVDSVTRKQLSESLPSVDDGGRTAIGKGLREAINVLTYGSGTPEGGLIMLITDGEENVIPYIEDVLPEVLQYNVIINAVAFGSEASDKLENMTTVTGGRGYFFSNDRGRPSSALDSAFLESITSQADIELQPVQLKDETITLNVENTTQYVYVDEELGKETKFTITSPHIQRVHGMILESPSGAIINSFSPYYSRDNEARQRIQISLPEAEPGRWTVTIQLSGDYPISVAFSVSSEPKDIRDQPIRVRSWLNEIQLKFPAYAKIYAEVKKGYLAVVEAEVIATVERPVGPTVDVDLRDDGLGADVTENDGIYTAYFTHFNGNGRYAVIARVTNNGQARLKLGSAASAAPAMPVMKGDKDVAPTAEFMPTDFEAADPMKIDDESEEFETAPASRFDRSSNSGAFRMEYWRPDAGDVIPPGDIMDLKVISTHASENNSKKEVSLQFTTPGNDLDVGQVHSLELRVSRNKQKLITNFDSGIEINETFITNGSLTPLPPRQKATITVLIPEHLERDEGEPWSIYFAIKGKDEVGNISTKFNVAEATFGIKIGNTRSNHETGVVKGTKGSHDDNKEDDNDESPTQNTNSEIFNTESVNTEIITNVKLTDNGENNEVPEEKLGNDSFKWWPLAVGIGVAILVIMLVVLITVLIIKKTRMKTYFSVQSEQC